MQDPNTLEITELHNYWPAYYEAAELLHKEIKSEKKTDAYLSMPRNYMYALALEMNLKEILFSVTSFSKKDEHHRLADLFNKAEVSLKLVPELSEYTDEISNSKGLLEKLSQIILWSARYYYPKCPKQKQYDDHAADCQHEIQCNIDYYESNPEQEFVDGSSPELSDQQLSLVRNFIKSYGQYRKEHCLSSWVNKIFPTRTG